VLNGIVSIVKAEDVRDAETR